MPYFMHQWTYKDKHAEKMVAEPQDRQRVVRLAAESFDGELIKFFFCFGDYDGMAITKFDSNEQALACILSVFSRGELATVKTTVLIAPQEGQNAMREARGLLKDHKP